MAGGGDARIIGANSRVGEGVANVTGHALWVRVVAGGGGGPVTITGPLPLPIDIAAQTVDVEVVQPTHDDLNANANIQVGDADVGVGNPVPISVTGQPIAVSDGGLSITVDGTIGATQSGLWTQAIGPTVKPGTGALNLGKAEDAPHASGDVGVMALAVRNDAGASLAGTDGDYIPLTTDSQGALWVRSIMSRELLSSSALGEPQTVGAAPVTIHDPAASGSATTRDLMTIYISNPNNFDDEITFFWQSGNTTVVFAPARETVSAMDGIPIDFGEILGASASNPFAVQSLEVFGFVERGVQ